jgi:hypothetical protein
MPDEESQSPSPPTQDDGLTVRERRALHAKQTARKEAPVKLARKAIGPAIVILLVAGISAGFYFEAKSQPDCPGHWHAAYAVFVNNTQVPFPNDFAHRGMYNPPSGHDHHLHDDNNIYHFHPGVIRCIPTEDLVERLDITIRGTTMTLGPAHGSLQGSYGTQGDMVLQIWHQPYGKEWRQIRWSAIDDKQLGDGDRILFSYGVPDESTLAAQKEVLRDLGGYDPKQKDPALP